MTVYFPINNTEHKLIHSVYWKKVSIKKNVYKQKKFDIVISPKLCSPGYDVLFLGSYLCHLKEFIFIDNFNHMTFSTLNIWRCKMLDTLIGAVYKHHTDLIPAGTRLSNMIIKYPLENFHGFFSFFYRCSIWIWKLRNTVFSSLSHKDLFYFLGLPILFDELII